jgi:hypothetical protein
VLLPVGARLGDLFWCAGHEVPPHEDRFLERVPADQQEAASGPAGEGCAGAPGAQVIQRVFLYWLILKLPAPALPRDGSAPRYR